MDRRKCDCFFPLNFCKILLFRGISHKNVNPPNPALTLPLLRCGHVVPLLSTSPCTGGGGSRSTPLGQPHGITWALTGKGEGLGAPAGRR